MKRFILLIILFVSFATAYSQVDEKLSPEEKARREKNIQAGNPFKKYGYYPKIATLSKGKYLEFHDLDTIVHIGSFTFNTNTMKIVGYNRIDENDDESMPRPDLISRWFSPDPLSEEFPSWSPYNFSLNNPIRFIDPDGRASEDIVDKNGNKLDISISNNKLVYGDNVSKDVRTVLNNMWKIKTGQEQVKHLLTTKSKVYLNVSDKVGVVAYNGKFYAVYGLTGPTDKQSHKLIKDYDGGKVYAENTLTLYKGTYEYGKGIIQVVDEKNATVISFDNKKVDVNGNIDIEPSQHPDLIYQNETQFYNLTGVHETEHTKSSNIKLQRKNKDAEAPAYDIENQSRKELNNGN